MGTYANATASATAVASGGVSFSGLLTILFIALKLIGVISWSWLWVLAPIWLPFLVLVAFLLIGLVIFVAVKVLT